MKNAIFLAIEKLRSGVTQQTGRTRPISICVRCLALSSWAASMIWRNGRHSPERARRVQGDVILCVSHKEVIIAFVRR